MTRLKLCKLYCVVQPVFQFVPFPFPVVHPCVIHSVSQGIIKLTPWLISKILYFSKFLLRKIQFSEFFSTKVQFLLYMNIF